MMMLWKEMCILHRELRFYSPRIDFFVFNPLGGMQFSTAPLPY